MASRSERPATKSDWHTEPMPEQCTTIELSHTFSKAEKDAIQKGFVPEAMEEKWFMYYEPSERKLYMHRSWTGFCVYEVQFEERDESFVAVSAVVNRDSSQYSCTDDEDDCRSLLTIISSVLLGGSGFLGGNPLQAWAVLGRHSLQ